MPQRRSVLAVIAFVCAIAAFFVSPVAGFFLGLGAVLLGALGLLRSASSRVGGALPSVLAIAAGLVAVVVKILEGVLRLLF